MPEFCRDRSWCRRVVRITSKSEAANWSSAVLLSLMVLLSPSEARAAGERIALVIGNANYVHERPLANPHNDVEAVKNVLLGTLKFKGGDILVLKDQPFKQLVAEIKKFQERAKTAEIALIFYSGHGIAFNDANYIAPIDIPRELVMKNSPEDPVVHLDEVQNAVAGARVGLIFWDACRTNTVQTSIDPRARQTTASRGLIPVASVASDTNAVGTFISFATNPRQTADDGRAGELSPFTRALTKRIATRGSTFIDVMALVSGDVASATNQSGRPQFPEVRMPKITQQALKFALLPSPIETSRPSSSTASSGSANGGSTSGSTSRPKPPSAPARSGGGGGSIGVAPGAGGGGGAGLF